MFAQTRKISWLCVIFLKKYLEISTENYTFANVILNTIFYLKKTNTYWWSASRCEVGGIRFLYRFYFLEMKGTLSGDKVSFFYTLKKTATGITLTRYFIKFAADIFLIIN